LVQVPIYSKPRKTLVCNKQPINNVFCYLGGKLTLVKKQNQLNKQDPEVVKTLVPNGHNQPLYVRFSLKRNSTRQLHFKKIALDE